MTTCTFRLTSLRPFALLLGFVAGCSGTDSPSPPGADDAGPTSGSTGTSSAGLTSGGPTNGGPTNGFTTAASTTVGPTGFGPTTAGSTTAGPTTAGPTTAGPTGFGPTTAGPTTGTSTSAGLTTGGFTTGGLTMGAGGMGGATSTGTTSATTASSTTSGTTEPDCNAQMPTIDGVDHSMNGSDGEGNLAWEIWSNTGRGELTTFPGIAAFRASWSDDGGYLGRMGFEWGNNGPVHTAHGRIHAQFVANKTVVTGNGGGEYSYIGMYGWTTNPCVEWYVVDDTFKTLPFNPGGTVDKGDIELDGGTYKVYTRDTTGTGGSRCSSSITNWIQYYSIRTSPRSCGVISLTDHFEAWESKGMSMAGNLLEAKILAEVGGDTGSVDFPVANVTTTE